MKNILMVVLALMMSRPAYADITPTAQINSGVIAELNQPVQADNAKITTGSWIWVSIFAIIGIVAGTMAYNTKKPI